ncbi:orotidine-5'-phosphate decarboxylase [Candidatus Gracilibacteria bacterium]|jgi:orotidine-5'-phosphate decarboxylase|nr:orotidine-5'-phosphate decarboxylase [Candidatus Gracilibacteria bacterium]NJM88172.1 orotidine-5'-phosphate decarboxylase [Hydrococcus sp. RU_2_2]NJP19619.1 orotidine-5'-phosphate decarboxylase [Hydrococcus sp. CRU_1_1]
MVSDRIIVPLDVPTLEDAIALLDKLPQVSFWKVGLELFVGAGPEILKILNERQKRIFLDLKFHDIPNTVAGACRSATAYNVDLLTLHATAGRAALQAAAEAIAQEGSRPKLLAITLLTSLNSRELAFDLKIPLELPEYALQMAILAKESGIDGAVCSPHEVAQLRQVCSDNFLLVCPGVRPSWSDAGDQRRVMTPQAAIKAGANYLVIGRPITAAANPVEAWERICEELATVG